MSEIVSLPTQNADATVPQDQHTSGKKKEKKIPVVEIFGPTIEGEGAVIGTQTMFLRFGLCDFKCTKCDSWHSVDPTLVKKLAAYLTQSQIYDELEKITPPHIRTVTFSGGNPAIHDLTELVVNLKAKGWKIVVETQGTKSPGWLTAVDHVVVSPKGPGMGEKFNPVGFKEFARNVLWGVDDFSIKVVVFDNRDLEFALGVAEVLEDEGLAFKNRFFLSLGNNIPPKFMVSGDSVINDSPANNELVMHLLDRYNVLSEEIMQDPRLSFAKFLPQLHVLVWGNETEK